MVLGAYAGAMAEGGTTSRLLRLVPVLALLALPVLPAGAAAPQAVFVLDGKGHGHGVGMAQDSANAMAAAGASHGQILDLFYPGTRRAVRSSPIRVAVWEAGAPNGTVTVAAPRGARVSSDAGVKDAPAGAVLQVSVDGAGYHVRQVAPARGSAVRAGLLGGEASPEPSPTNPPPLAPLPTAQPEPSPSVTSSAPAPTPAPPGPPAPRPTRSPAAGPAPAASPSGFSFDSASPVTLSPAGDGTLTVRTTGREYRGSLIALSREGFRLVNVLDVETYLRGLGEVPAGWPLAALRTQAVAARTYALRAVGGPRPLGYDLCDDTRCQVYLGVGGERARTTQATRETRGQVVTFGGRLADTFYSANAGGVTATPGEGFGGSTTIPYLPGGTKAPGGVDPWKVTASPQDIAGRLGYGGRLDRIAVEGKGLSGRATRVRLEGSVGARTLTGIEFQRRLGLRSTLFTVTRGTGTAQALPAPDAAVTQLAPAQAAMAAAVPLPSAASSPTLAPEVAAPATVVSGAAAEGVPPLALAAAVGALLVAAAAGSAAAYRLR